MFIGCQAGVFSLPKWAILYLVIIILKACLLFLLKATWVYHGLFVDRSSALSQSSIHRHQTTFCTFVGQVPGKIVIYNQEWKGYGETIQYRLFGASRASAYGAVGALIRSMTDFSIYSPHTGSQVKCVPHKYTSGQVT